MKRRDFLRTAGGTTVAAGAAAAGAGTAAAQSISYDGWLDDVGNFDGSTADATGQGEVTVTVGAQGNGGAFAFDPPAVHVDTGTTVIWEWTGQGGQHNVVEDGGGYESELSSEEGFTFEHTFEESGISKYYCSPHRSLGMKGAVAVGEVGGGGEGGGGGGGGEVELHDIGVAVQAHWVGSATILGIIVTLIYSFFVLKYGESPNTGNTGGGE